MPTGTGIAPDKVRAALAYAQSNALTADPQKALQTQYAIWQLLGTQGVPAGDATTQDVVAKAIAAPANPQGTSVLDAAKANQIKLTLNNWQPVGAKVQITPTTSDNFYGRGQVTVENTSKQALTLYMPVGTVFAATDNAFQDVAGYATNVQVTNPQVAQQLPATSGGAPSSALLLGVTGLALLAAGCHVLRARIRTM